VTYLTRTGRRTLFFTNNPSASAGGYSDKLSSMGIPADPADILTSGEATARHLLTETPYRRVYLVGVPSLEEEFRMRGLELVEENPDAVVLAFDKTLTYEKLEHACHLLRAGLPYIATNPDKVCPTEHGPIPDCGSMAALLFEATGRKPQFIGKPNAEMVRMGLDKLGNANPATAAMVGDRTYTDMEMAYSTGITSILVLSGETTQADVDGLQRRPDYVFDSVRELHGALKEADNSIS
jgi:HAD superfamily hydrolase (TIGR01450 family)